MRLEPYVHQVAEQLAATAALGDDRTREIAASLAAAAAPALRLAVLTALSDGADEITAALLDLPGAPVVSIRLDGDEAVVDVRAGAVSAPADDEPAAEDAHGGEATARISLRLSDALKTDIDAAAERDGVSVNTWLVRVASTAVKLGSAGDFAAKLAALGGLNGLGGHGGLGGFGAAFGQQRGRNRNDSQRVTGWVNG
ncbi:hypothetical protein [uncultured Jatrophihabitans sp.]|uniref:hypothetical protein n=1 Tax=uncultured Jatrophihabitans sp. TaxID=1610747 RepID=UPI0035C9BA41